MKAAYSLDQLLRVYFPVIGQTVPVDHHQAFYAAISKEKPRLHELNGLAFSPIIGGEAYGSRMKLNKFSRISFQVPQSHLGEVVSLAGRKLRLQQELIRLGVPQLRPILPSQYLYTRFLTIKNATTKEKILEKIDEQLQEIGISKQKPIVRVLRRRVIQIHNQSIVGWGIYLSGLDEEDSLLIQLEGVGGRRRYGAGFFVPVRSDSELW